MLSNKRRDTGPELAVRRGLHSLGLRYRVDWRPTEGSRTRADIAFTRRRLLIFIDGCFWHGCPEHRTTPQTNADYWVPKLQRNIERDAEATALLRANGWRVARFWEHEPAQEIVDAICELLATDASPDESSAH